MNLKSIKPLLMFVSVLSFLVSLIFTINLLSSQATTGADKVLFGGLALSAELGKVLLFSIGMMLLFIMKNKQYSWLGVPVLLISFAFTVLSIVGTLGALETKNAEKTEASILNSDKYNMLKSQIGSLEQQAQQLRQTAAGQPSTWGTHNEAIQSAQKAEEQKAKLIMELQNIQVSGTGAQNALYVAVARFFGCDVEDAKFHIMASYGIGLEALSLFCALFAFFGILDKKKQLDNNIDFSEDLDFDDDLLLENHNLKKEIEFFKKLEEEQPAQIEARNVGFMANHNDHIQEANANNHITPKYHNGMDLHGYDGNLGEPLLVYAEMAFTNTPYLMGINKMSAKTGLPVDILTNARDFYVSKGFIKKDKANRSLAVVKKSLFIAAAKQHLANRK